MDNTSLIQELQKSLNAIYWIMGQLTCDRELEEELYPVVHQIERVITSLEQNNDNEEVY